MGIVEDRLMSNYGLSYLKFDEEIGNPIDKMDTEKVLTLTDLIREESPFGGFMYRFTGGHLEMPRVIPLTEFSLRMRVMLISNPTGSNDFAYLFDQRGLGGYGSGWVFVQKKGTDNGMYGFQQYTNQVFKGGVDVYMEIEKWYDLLITFDGHRTLKTYFLGEEVEPVVQTIYDTELPSLQSDVALRIGNYLQGSQPSHFKLDTFEVYNKVLTPYDFATGYIAYKATDGNMYAPYGRKVRLLPRNTNAVVKSAGYPVQVLDEHRGIDLNREVDSINVPALLVTSIGEFKVYNSKLPSDFSGLVGNTSNKYLVYHGGVYKFFSPTGGWTSIGSNISSENITDTSMNDLSTVSPGAWKVLTGNKELYVISSNTSDDEISIDVQVDIFKLSTLLGKNCQAVYVSNTGREVKVVKGTKPIDVDTILDGAELILEKRADLPIAVTYESNDISVYRKLGSTVDYGKLHRPERVVKPVVTANWTPLDMLDSPEIVFTSTLGTAEKEQEVRIVSNGTKLDSKYTTEINLAPIHLKSILPQISLRHPETEFKFALTQDNRTWHVRQGTKAQTFNNISEIHAKGMDIEEITDLTEDRLKQLTALRYLVTVGIKTSKRSFHKETLDFIQVTEDVPHESPAVVFPEVCIINSEVSLNLEFLGSVLKGVLEDPDRGMLRYKVTLNGEKYMPRGEEEEWTEWLQANQSVFIQLNSSDVVIGETNTLIIEVEDYFGNSYSDVFEFVGEYPGLMFKDPANGYYTSDIGEIIKYLEVGVLQQGQTSPQFEIHLVNNNPFEIYDTTLVGSLSSNGISLEFSKTGMPFMAEYNMTFEEVIGYKEIKPFFIRLVAGRNAEITQNGLFSITAESKMVE